MSSKKLIFAPEFINNCNYGNLYYQIVLGPDPFMLFCVNYYFFLGSLGNNPYLCNQIN